MTLLPERRGDHVALFHGIITVSFSEPIRSAWCHYCGRAGANTRDHIVAKSKGGSSQWWNLVPAHRSCNRAKADGPSDCSCGFCARARSLHSKRRVR